MRKPTTLHKLLTITLMMALAGVSTLTGTATAQTAPLVGGELAVLGNVLLNDMPAISGATIFSESKLKTTANAGAMISLGRGGKIDLGPNTEMVVRFSGSNIGGNLLAGNATVSAPEGIAVSVVTAEGTALSEGKAASLLTVDVSCGNVQLSATRNEAKLVANGKTEIVAEGQQTATPQNPIAPRCARLAAAAKPRGLSPWALALLIAGIGGAIAGIIAAGTNDNPPSGIVVSSFRPRSG